MAKRKLNAGDRLFTRAMIVLFCVVFGLFGYDLVKGLVNVQLVRGAEYAAKAKEGQLHDTELAAPRGTIYDTNGAPIAQSTSAGRVYINPNSLSKLGNRAALLEEVCDGLASVLGVSAARVRQQAGYTERNYMVLKGQVELDRMEKVNAFRAKECVLEYVEGGEPRRDKDGKLLLDAKGNPRAGDSNDKVATYAYFIGVSADVKRFYPLGSFAANLLGFTGAEDVGRAGLELLYNSELTGTPGRVVTAKNAADSNLNIYYETNYDAVPGNSLVLTIDEVIQRYLDRALEQAQIDAKAKAAYGIIMDVKTGAILGMSCAPSYDPGNYEAVADPKKREEIAAIADPEKREAARKEAMMAQWRNGTIELTYEPGSVFKTVTLSAALEEGLTSPGEHYTCTGSIRIANRTIHCHKRTGHGNQDLARGLMNSCNPFMITLGQRMGVKTFYKYFTAFGFTEPTGIDLPNEFKPTKGINIHAQDKMGIVELASCSFGQSFEASPIQILSAVSAIANGGKLMQPYVVKKVLDAEGRTVRETQPTVRRQVISAETAKTVCGMMEQVVSNGTGRNGYVSGGRVAGKTGTSQKLSVGSGYVASFVSFAPADAPEVAMLIAIDEPGGDMINGGQLAAPPTAEVLENVLVYKNIEMRYTEKEKEQLGGSAPDMVTLTPTAAKEKLQTAGYTAKIIGEGSSVLRQIPEPGQSIQQGGLVILYTGENTERTVKVPKLTNLSLSEAKRVAAEVGLNIKLTGNLQSQSLFTYRQSIAEGAEVPLGTAVTVNIMTDNGIRDR